MAEIDPNEHSGHQFCGNCGTATVRGATACAQCGSTLDHEDHSQELTGDYIPYCRACGVPVAKDEALHCTKCGVTPLCREHYYPSTRSCSLCPPFELPEPGEPGTGTLPDRLNGPWAQPAVSVPCPQCGVRIREGVQFCPNCGKEQEGAEDSRYAGFLVRLGAFITDNLILVVPAAILNGLTDIPAFGTLLSVIYYVVFTYAKGQTPGKMLWGIHVVDKDGHKPSLKQVVFREVIGKTISALALLIGYIWIIWDPKKRSWHDHIGGTSVVRRKRG